MKNISKLAAVLLTMVVLTACIPFGITASAEEDPWRLESYDEWLKNTDKDNVGKDALHIDTDNADIELIEGDTADFEVNLKSGGLYLLKIGYKAMPSENLFSSPIELSISVNGKIPYREASSVFLSRVFSSQSQRFETDEKGNQLQPDQTEVTPDMEYLFSDSAGYHPEGLYLDFHKGVNTVSIKAVRSGIYINHIELLPLQDMIDYQQYRKLNDKKVQNSDNAKPIFIEAENIFQKSDCTVSPVTDRSTSSVTPNAPDKMLLNTVGNNFSKVGQWISWQIDVKRSGYYKISLYAKQGITPGAVSARKLLIDGKAPFKEAENFSFPYSQEYKNYVLSDKNEELLFYLEKGIHEIALRVELGDMSGYLNRVSDILARLNSDYLDILFYTGSSPDMYREYGFDKLIPDVLEDFIKASDELKGISSGIKKLSSGMGGNTASLDKLSDLLYKMGKNTDLIAKNFSQFKESLSSLGTWINDYSAQPLQIDSLAVTPQKANIESKKESFFSNLIFKFKIFLCSFTNDYESVNSKKEAVNVWIATGRDQSKIIKRLANNNLEKFDFDVNVSLVAADALLPNVLAGSDIDVFLSADAASPINYAIREAVLDLKQFDDFEEVSKRFHKAALVPFTYKDAVYALPESFDFPLMFYRKDILNGLGLSVPKTWEDFYEAVAILQKNNLTVGVNWLDMFNTILYQNGGSYYNKELNKSALDNYVSLNAFEKTLKLYTDYALPVEFSFPNRFRSGDMPLGIVNYTMYNQLYLFAPEIAGLWEFTSVPGTIKEDGTINNSVIASGTGDVILKTTKNKENAWEFLKWWTSTDTQINFGIEMEKVMGSAARQSSANIDVVKGFPWSANEFGVIESQWKNLNVIPQIPGSYYMGRTLDFAFNSVYTSGQDASRVLCDNVIELNQEIERKMKEFERK